MKVTNKSLKKMNFFTLVEVLIVIAIIGIIAGFGVPKFSAYREAAYAKKRVAAAENLLTAIDAYVVANNVSEPETIAFGTAADDIEKFLAAGYGGLRVNGADIETGALNLDTSVYKLDVADADYQEWLPYGTDVTAYKVGWDGKKND